MSEQEKPEGGGDGGGEGGTKASPSGNKDQTSKLPVDWTVQVKQVVDDAINSKLPKIETPKPEETKPDVTKTEIPQSVIDSITAKISQQFESKIKDLTENNNNLKTTVDGFVTKEREQAIGTMLLNYQDFFRGQDGKVDTKSFDENLKYWIGKEAKEDQIKEDMNHSFEVAKNYINILATQTEKPKYNITETVTQKPEENLSKRDRIIREVEDEQNKLGIVQKAGNVETDELESAYQRIVSKKGNNETIVNSNERVY